MTQLLLCQIYLYLCAKKVLMFPMDIIIQDLAIQNLDLQPWIIYTCINVNKLDQMYLDKHVLFAWISINCELRVCRGGKLRFHAANSGAILHGLATDLDFVRPGIAVYGLPPGESTSSYTLQSVPLQCTFFVCKLAHSESLSVYESNLFGGSTFLYLDCKSVWSLIVWCKLNMYVYYFIT